jgi:hypothetical protein
MMGVVPEGLDRLLSSSAGTGPIPPEPVDPAVRLGFIAAARRIRRHGSVLIGLLNASPDLVSLPLGLHLARSLAELGQRPVAVLAAGSLPLRDLPQPTADEPDALYTTHWLEPTLALLNPLPGDTRAFPLQTLIQAGTRSAGRFAHLVADLSGFTALGDNLGAIRQVDGVVILAQAGATDEDILLALAADLPPHRHLGVLVIGGDAA